MTSNRNCTFQESWKIKTKLFVQINFDRQLTQHNSRTKVIERVMKKIQLKLTSLSKFQMVHYQQALGWFLHKNGFSLDLKQLPIKKDNNDKHKQHQEYE